MTINEAKNKLIEWARNEIGYYEGNNNWNKYAPLWEKAGGWNAQNQPWCDIFVDTGFIECFGIELASKLTYQPIGSFSALCSASAQFYKNNKAWYITPEVGDQVFFYSGGGINHTGIVETVSGGYFTTIEGNSSDMVARRNYYVGNSYVSGFGRPNWNIVQFSNDSNSNGNTNTIPSSNTSSSNTSTPNTSQSNSNTQNVYPLIKRGSSKKIAVRSMQELLNKKGYDLGKWGVDGDFGWDTFKALKEFQRKNGLEVDGECGNYSWCCLITGKKDGSQPPVLKKGDSSNVVKSAQQLLMLYGYSCGSSGDDGEFGNDTEKAVKEFQKTTMGIIPTGIINSNAWKFLIGGK